jgi:hypothetical protein
MNITLPIHAVSTHNHAPKVAREITVRGNPQMHRMLELKNTVVFV